MAPGLQSPGSRKLPPKVRKPATILTAIAVHIELTFNGPATFDSGCLSYC